jgi:hypothetical protein
MIWVWKNCLNSTRRSSRRAQCKIFPVFLGEKIQIFGTLGALIRLLVWKWQFCSAEVSGIHCRTIGPSLCNLVSCYPISFYSCWVASFWTSTISLNLFPNSHSLFFWTFQYSLTWSCHFRFFTEINFCVAACLGSFQSGNSWIFFRFRWEFSLTFC